MFIQFINRGTSDGIDQYPGMRCFYKARNIHQHKYPYLSKMATALTIQTTIGMFGFCPCSLIIKNVRFLSLMPLNTKMFGFCPLQPEWKAVAINLYLKPYSCSTGSAKRFRS